MQGIVYFLGKDEGTEAKLIERSEIIEDVTNNKIMREGLGIMKKNKEIIGFISFIREKKGCKWIYKPFWGFLDMKYTFKF